MPNITIMIIKRITIRLSFVNISSQAFTLIGTMHICNEKCVDRIEDRKNAHLYICAWFAQGAELGRRLAARRRRNEPGQIEPLYKLEKPAPFCTDGIKPNLSMHRDPAIVLEVRTSKKEQ